MTRGAARAVLIGCLAVAGARARALAQTTTLTITGGSTETFSQPALADYVNGFIDGPTISFTVSTTGGSNNTHTAAVEICANTTTLGSGKALSNLMWEPSDGSKSWQSITSSCSGAVQASRTVASKSLARNGSFSSGVKLRMMLDWTDTATSYGTTVVMTVNVSTP